MATNAEIHAAFGRRAIALWEYRGLSGREVMRRAGVSQNFITRLGRGDGLSLAAAVRISRALGVPLGDLLEPAACAGCLGEPPAGFTCNSCGTGAEAPGGR